MFAAIGIGPFDTAWLAEALILTTPILLAAMGELISERAGVLNVGLEGFMLAGAFFSYLMAWKAHSLFVGVVCGIAGILLASRITSGQPNAAVGLELSVISACVLGGVSLAGGRATMSGVIVGVLIMGIAENAMNLLNIPAFYQYIVRGVILLLAVLLDNLRSSALGRR